MLARLRPGAILHQHRARRAGRSRGARRGRRARAACASGSTCSSTSPTPPPATFHDPLAQLPGVYGTHHIGASTDQAQEAIAAETVRIVRAFAETGRVPNVVNLARRTPATHMLVVRHRDRPGVLAHVFGHLRERAPQRAGDREHRLRGRARRRRPHQSRQGARRRAARQPARPAPTSSTCRSFRCNARPCNRVRSEPVHADHRSTHLQLQRRSRGPAPARPRRGAARSRVAAGRRHVDARDQPPVEGVRIDHRTRPKPTSARSPACPTTTHVLFLQGGASLQFSMVPMNLLPEGGTRRLRRHRRVVAEGGQGGQAPRQGDTSPRPPRPATSCACPTPARSTGTPTPPTPTSPRTTRSSARSSRRCRSRAVVRRRPAARVRRVVRHLQPADRRRQVRPDLRRRAEEPRARPA